MRKVISLVMILFSLFTFGCNSSNSDGRYNKAKTSILAELNDPDSYKMEYYKANGSLRSLYKVKFRATNYYGAKIVQYAYVFFNDKGDVERVFIREKEDKFLDELIDLSNEVK